MLPGQAVVADQRDSLLHSPDGGPGGGQLGYPGVAASQQVSSIGARRQAVHQVERSGQRGLDLADGTDEPR